jgi:hypothetical protein
MGTRHLIAVVVDGEYKIAQYGQWDGYPKGQGIVILEFLHKHSLNVLATKARQCKYLSEKTINALWEKYGAVNGSISLDKAEKIKKDYPELSRDTGAKILDLVYSSKKGLNLENSLDFAKDSIFCEWAYVIDLDKRNFEVYKGFNHEPVDKSARFQGDLQKGTNETFYPVKLVKSFSLDKLPTVAGFKVAFEEPVEIKSVVAPRKLNLN